MSDTLPTMIVAPPVTKKLQCATGGSIVKWYLCDDGRWYTLKDLARVCGLAIPTIYHRISRHGWDSPEILAPVGQTKDFVVSLGTPEWQALGSRVRAANLEQLRPGTWERQEGTDEQL